MFPSLFVDEYHGFLFYWEIILHLVISAHMQISDSAISLHYMLYVNWNAKTHAQLMIDTP